MDKGQHLPLLIKTNDATGNKLPIALARDLTFHLSAQVENATTKDSTDTNGAWQENEVTGISGDVQFGALIGVGDDSGAQLLNDIINGIDDSQFDWELAVVGGNQNRVVTTSIATGKGKMASVQMTGQNRQNATYSGTMNLYGPYTVVDGGGDDPRP